MINPIDLQTRYNDHQQRLARINQEGWQVPPPCHTHLHVTLASMRLPHPRALSPITGLRGWMARLLIALADRVALPIASS